MLWGNLPWLVMGAGLEFGFVPSIFSFFRPGDRNPFVLAWFAVVVAEWILGFHWIFVQNGAQFLVDHPGVFRRDFKSTTGIKGVYCLMVAAGIAALIFMIVSPPPVLFE
jgi:hypothetical protein